MRREWIRTFADSLPRSADVVTYPDHPFLLRGPDILAGRRGALTAYFLISPQRQGRHNLTTRLLLSQLALPGNTAFCVVDQSDWDYIDELGGLVDEIDRSRNRSRTALVAPRRATRDAVDFLRPIQFERFAETWARMTRVTQGPQREVRGVSTASALRRDEPATLGSSRAIEPMLEPDEVGPPQRSVRSRTSYAAAISREVQKAVVEDFGLSRDPYGFRDAAGLIASGDAYLEIREPDSTFDFVPARTSDSLKPARAAAFAGVQVNIPEF